MSREIATIKSRLQRLSPVAEPAEYNRMFGDLVALEQRRKVLSDTGGGRAVGTQIGLSALLTFW